MNVEKLKRLQAQVRIGGKGTPRRKKKVMHQTAATDDKKLQSSLKKLSVSTIPGIEEVNIIKDDLTVIHFNNPKAQASLSANTFAVTGHGETKKIVEMLPEILPQLGQETVVQLRMFANSMSAASTNPKQGNAAGGGLAANVLGSVVEEDDVPMLVSDFDEVAKLEAANGTKQTKSKGKGKENQPQEALPADIPKDESVANTENTNNISNEEKTLKDDKKLSMNVTAETGQKPKDKPAGKDAKKGKKQDKQDAGDKTNKTNKDNKKPSGENKKDNLNKNPPMTVVEGVAEKKVETLDAQLKELPTAGKDTKPQVASKDTKQQVASKDTKPSNKEPMMTQPKEEMEKLSEQPVEAKQAKKQNQEKVSVKKAQSPAKETTVTPAANLAVTTDGKKNQKMDKPSVETTKPEEKTNLQPLRVEAIEQKQEIAAEIQGKPAELLVKLEEIKKEPEAETPKDSEVIQPKLEELKPQATDTPKPLADLEIKVAKPSENTSAETKDAKPSEQTSTVILEIKPEQTPVAAYITSLDANQQLQQAKQEKLESTAVGSVPVDQQKPLEDKQKTPEEKTAIVEIKQSKSPETPTVINLEAIKEKASDLVATEIVEKSSSVTSAAIPLPDKPKEEIVAEKKLDLEAINKPLDKDPKKKGAIAKEEPKADMATTNIEGMTITTKGTDEAKTDTGVQSKEPKRPETKLIIEATQQPPIPMPMAAAPEQKDEQKSGNKTPTAASPQQKTSPPKQTSNKKTPPPQDATKQQTKSSTPSAKAANNEAKKPEGAKAKQASPPKAQQQQQAAKSQTNVAKSQQQTTKSSPSKTPEKALGPTSPTKTPDKPTTPTKSPDKAVMPTTPIKSPDKSTIAPTTPTKSPDKAVVPPTTSTKTPDKPAAPTKSQDKAVVMPTTPTKSPDKPTIAPTTPTKSPDKAVVPPTTPTKTPDKPTTPTKSPDKSVMTPTTPTKSPEKPAIAPKPAAPSKSTTPTKTTAPAQGQSKNKATTPESQADPNKKSTTTDTGAKAKGAKNRQNTSGNASAKGVPPLQTTKQTTPPKAEVAAAKQPSPPTSSQTSQPSSN